jgi:hypothetical protein
VARPPTPCAVGLPCDLTWTRYIAPLQLEADISKHSVEQLAELDDLLQRSIAKAGEFLRRSFEMPEHSLSATQLVRYLETDRVVALSTTTARGAPRVAPVASVFFGGRFHMPKSASSARARHAVSRPEISLTHYVDVDVAIIAHGVAEIVGPEHPAFAPLNAHYQAEWFQQLCARGEGVYLRLDARTLYTYVRDPVAFAV